MANCIVNSVEDALAELKNLEAKHWYICQPSSIEAATEAPSSKNTYFTVDQTRATGVVIELIAAVRDIFKSNCHQVSTWKEFAIDTDVSVLRSVIGYRGSKSESQLRESLLSPILSTIAHTPTWSRLHIV